MAGVDGALTGAALLIGALGGSRDPLVIQKFIPAVSKGDKRIILIDGEPVRFGSLADARRPGRSIAR